MASGSQTAPGAAGRADPPCADWAAEPADLAAGIGEGGPARKRSGERSREGAPARGAASRGGGERPRRGAHGRGGGCTEEGRAAKEWGAPRRRAHGRGWGGARRRDAHDRGAGRYGVDPELRGPAALDACGRGGEEGVVRPWDAPVRRRAGERAKELPGSGRSDPSWEARWFLSGPGGTPVLFCKMGLGTGQAAQIVMLQFEEAKVGRG